MTGSKAPFPPARGRARPVPVDASRVARAREGLPAAARATRLAGLLSLIAEPVRLRILCALDDDAELTVGDLAAALGASQDQVTYGLRLLRAAGLVLARKDGRTVWNRLADDPGPLPLRRSVCQLTATAGTEKGG